MKSCRCHAYRHVLSTCCGEGQAVQVRDLHCVGAQELQHHCVWLNVTLIYRTPLPWASELYGAKTWLPKKEYLHLLDTELSMKRLKSMMIIWRLGLQFWERSMHQLWTEWVLAEAKKRLVIVLMFRRESRLLDCEDSLLPSWCLAWNWSWDKGEGIGFFLFYLLDEWFSAKIKR